MAPPNPTDSARIAALARTSIADTLIGLKRFIDQSRWLGRNNRYRRDTVKKISVDVGPLGINQVHLSQYIAASALLHCSDGWSYLGKAIFSLLRGDPHRARHMAYYAELRAVMSLLASEGIGIFQNQHFVVSAPNKVLKLTTGANTHSQVWSCFEYWSSLPKSGVLLGSVIRPYGRTLAEWLVPRASGAALTAQAQKWFLEWGMDLRLPNEDRNARNESSYRPDGIARPWEITAPNAADFVLQLWQALEPAAESAFSTIDRHILRLALEAEFQGQHGVSPKKQPKQFASYVSSITASQGFDPNVAREWRQFLTRRKSKRDPSIFAVSGLLPTHKKFGYATVLARATLLLRVASGSALELLSSAQISAPNIEFWWRGVGKRTGLWEGEKGRNELNDLWADVSVLLQQVTEFRSRNTSDQTFHRLTKEFGQVVSGLAGCERVAVWSMTP